MIRVRMAVLSLERVYFYEWPLRKARSNLMDSLQVSCFRIGSQHKCYNQFCTEQAKWLDTLESEAYVRMYYHSSYSAVWNRMYGFAWQW